MHNIASYQEGYEDGYSDAKKKYRRSKGEWLVINPQNKIDYPHEYKCPFCALKTMILTKYCPECGADMR